MSDVVWYTRPAQERWEPRNLREWYASSPSVPRFQRQDHHLFPGVQDAKATAEKVADKVKDVAPEAPKRLDASSIGAALSKAAPEPQQAVESGARLITSPGTTAHSMNHFAILSPRKLSILLLSLP